MKYQEIVDMTKEVDQVANTETDNTFALRKYLVSKFNVEQKQANKMLGITDDFDYLE